jgi:hypothetical protein
MNLRTQRMLAFATIAAFFSIATLSSAQEPYKPKFPGDPAHSESEAAALGYMRTTTRAQKLYYKTNNKYATSLSQLVHVGSFTKRMTEPQHGDYTVGFRSHKDGYELTMTPKQLDADHRSFYAKEDGIIHADDQKAANEDSPKVK